MTQKPLFDAELKQLSPSISFTVAGKPQQRGSKTGFVQRNRGTGQMVRRGGGIITDARQAPIILMTDDNKHSKAYMKLAELRAREAWPGQPLAGPVCFEVEFHFERPKSHYRTGKFSDLMRDDAPEHHIQKPDLAKLIRGIEDAMTYARIWNDDSQVVSYGGTGKYWTKRAGYSLVTITPLTDTDKELFQ